MIHYGYDSEYYLTRKGWPDGDYHALIGGSIGIAYHFSNHGKISTWMKKQKPIENN